MCTCILVFQESKACSALLSETLSAVDALDSAYLISEIVNDLMELKKSEIEIYLYTDNKSLYDAIGSYYKLWGS